MGANYFGGGEQFSLSLNIHEAFWRKHVKFSLLSVAGQKMYVWSIRRDVSFVLWAKRRGVEVSPSVCELQADGLDNYLMPEEDRHADYHMTRRYDGIKRPWSWLQGRDTLRRRRDLQISTWLSSWEKGRGVSLTLEKVFLRVVLKCCLRTPHNLCQVGGKNFVTRPSKHARDWILVVSNLLQPTELRLTHHWFMSRSLQMTLLSESVGKNGQNF